MGDSLSYLDNLLVMTNCLRHLGPKIEKWLKHLLGFVIEDFKERRRLRQS